MARDKTITFDEKNEDPADKYDPVDLLKDIPEEKKKKEEEGFPLWALITIISCSVLLVVGGGVWWYKRKKRREQESTDRAKCREHEERSSFPRGVGWA